MLLHLSFSSALLRRLSRLRLTCRVVHARHAQPALQVAPLQRENTLDQTLLLASGQPLLERDTDMVDAPRRCLDRSAALDAREGGKSSVERQVRDVNSDSRREHDLFRTREAKPAAADVDERGLLGVMQAAMISRQAHGERQINRHAHVAPHLDARHRLRTIEEPQALRQT